jgi:hypothetical protein
MKRKLFQSTLISLVLTTVLFIFSCNKSDVVEIDENTIASRLKFKKISDEEITAKGTIVRIEWDEWGRSSRNCDGWGLCNYTVTWFPENKSTGTPNDYNYSFPINYDASKNQFYLEMLLEEPVPIDLPLENHPLKVDEIMILNTKDVFDKDLIIMNGEYFFNSQLGEFGGFIIYFDN